VAGSGRSGPLNLRQIEVFRAIMISGSLSEAGRLLFVSQPAVSRALAACENRLGFPLFDRVKGRLHATPEAKRLFDIRRAFHPALEALGTVLIEDVAVPRSALPAMFASIERISAKYGIEIPTVAHAGDGNLHPNFIFTAPAIDGHVDVPDHVWAAADEMFLDCLRLGGTLTGEHGVGILKKRWLRDELGDDSFALQRQIKQVFDPANILNPGKVF
jgi:glycolate oxidase